LHLFPTPQSPSTSNPSSTTSSPSLTATPTPQSFDTNESAAFALKLSYDKSALEVCEASAQSYFTEQLLELEQKQLDLRKQLLSVLQQKQTALQQIEREKRALAHRNDLQRKKEKK
jgi:hypothetical protein